MRRYFFVSILSLGGWLSLHSSFLHPIWAQPPRQETAAPVEIPQQPIRIAVDMVNVLVSVTDKKGNLIPNLRQEDFSVLEDGKPQEIAFFALENNISLTLALLMDTSESAHPKLNFQKNAAATFFFQILKGKDRGLLAEFDAGITLLQDFTGDPNRLEKAMRSVRAGGGTSLYDAIHAICDEKLIYETGSKALLLVSDGDDSGSQNSLEAALELAQRADTTIYAISTSRGGFFGIPDKKSDLGDKTLSRFVTETGGRLYFPTREEDLEAHYRQVNNELRGRYAIGFISSNKARDGQFRRLEVKMRENNFRINYRKGYYAPQG